MSRVCVHVCLRMCEWFGCLASSPLFFVITSIARTHSHTPPTQPPLLHCIGRTFARMGRQVGGVFNRTDSTGLIRFVRQADGWPTTSSISLSLLS